MGRLAAVSIRKRGSEISVGVSRTMARLSRAIATATYGWLALARCLDTKRVLPQARCDFLDKN